MSVWVRWDGAGPECNRYVVRGLWNKGHLSSNTGEQDTALCCPFVHGSGFGVLFRYLLLFFPMWDRQSDVGSPVPFVM
jgi:hypothetical protein